ncbi:MAG: carbon-monoxide dehydrogenase large subunit [Gammaproteobacteria bacterium]|jgi:carbon-monoxide dehydrogenase large subunit
MNKQQTMTTAFAIGNSPRRLEDERLLRGEGRYLDDIGVADLAYASFVRSTHAHATLKAIDTQTAAAMPGVLTILTHEQLAHDALAPLYPNIRENPHTGEPFRYTPQPLLATDRVRHVGELIAIVIAESPAQALDAAEAISIDYRPLDAVVDIEAARQPDAPQLSDDVPGNCCMEFSFGNAQATRDAFAGAAHVIEMHTANHRIITNSMEPRGAIARYERDTGRYDLHASTQNVHVISTLIADALGVEHHRVRLHASDVGGGFGNRNAIYPEYPLLLWAAKCTERAVKWVSTRGEGFISDHQARDFAATAALALDDDGRFLALRVDSQDNSGAYLAGAGCGIQTHQYTVTPGGLYAIPAIELRIGAVLTNTVPIGVTRGPGFAEAINVIERLVDKAARELGMCRIEMRRKNLVTQQHMPWTNAAGTRIDSGNVPACLDGALHKANTQEFEQRRARALKDGHWLGLGLAMHVKATGGLPEENVNLAFDTDRVVFTTGTMAIGQGHETSFRQILCSLLGLTPAQIEYRAGDSDQIAMGGGHGSSRATYMASTAMVRASEAIIGKARAFIAEQYQVSTSDIEFESGEFRIHTRNETLPLLDIAQRARDVGQPLDTYQHITREATTFPNGCHVAEIAIDPRTGTVTLMAYTAVDDYGTQINPMLVNGQMHGAIAQGAGQALFERAVYDAGNGQLLSASFMDYCMPRADDLPSFATDTLATRCTTNPLGVKGCGEAGAVAGFPAVNNAIADALAVHGVKDIEEPHSAQRICMAIRHLKAT